VIYTNSGTVCSRKIGPPGYGGPASDDHRGDTYRAVYTTDRFESAVYVLHAFQKKSPSGIKTARTDVQIVTQRFKLAKHGYEARHGKAKK